MPLGEFPTSGSPPWHEADVSYVGWIPTILGHLSFSMIGVKGRWSSQRSINTIDDSKNDRIILTHEYRVSQDFPLWDWIIKCFKPSANQHYILTARTGTASIPFVESNEVRHLTDTHGVLFGNVHVVPWQQSAENQWDARVLIESVTKLLGYDNVSPDCPLRQTHKKIKDYQEKGNLVHKFSFAIFRTGEVRIWSSHSDALGYSKSDDFNANEKVILERLPRQIYYFLKDCAHCHYHHEKSSDQLLPLVPQVRVVGIEGKAAHDANELSWRREVLWGLARIIARYRREGDVKQLKRAQGILSYADAFQATLARVKRSRVLNGKSAYDADITIYDFAHTKQSLSSLDGLKTWKNGGNLQIFAAIFALVFSASSFWSSSVKTVESACKTHWSKYIGSDCDKFISANVIDVSLWISKHPLLFFSALALPMLGLYSYLVKDINTFTFFNKPARLIEWCAKIIGVEFDRLLKSALAGFIFAVIFLIITLYCILSFMKDISDSMHGIY